MRALGCVVWALSVLLWARGAAADPTVWPLDDARLRVTGNVFTMSPLKASPELEAELGLRGEDMRGKVIIGVYDRAMRPEGGRELDAIIAGLRGQKGEGDGVSAQSRRMADQLATLSRLPREERLFPLLEMLRAQPDTGRLADLYERVAVRGQPLSLRFGDLDPQLDREPWIFPGGRNGSFGSAWQINLIDLRGFGRTTLEKLQIKYSKPPGDFYAGLLDVKKVLDTTCLQVAPVPNVIFDLATHSFPRSGFAIALGWDGYSPLGAVPGGALPPDEYRISAIGANGTGATFQTLSAWSWDGFHHPNFTAADAAAVPGTTYEFVVRPYRGGQCFGNVATVAVTSLPPLPAPPVTGLAVTLQAAAGTTAIQWSPPAPGYDHSGSLLGYTLSRDGAALGSVSWRFSALDPPFGTKIWVPADPTVKTCGTPLLWQAFLGCVEHPTDYRPGTHTYTVTASWRYLTPASTSATVSITRGPVYGLADTHTHQFVHLGMGGDFFHGKPNGPIATALGDCAGNPYAGEPAGPHGPVDCEPVEATDDPRYCQYKNPDGSCLKFWSTRDADGVLRFDDCDPNGLGCEQVLGPGCVISDEGNRMATRDIFDNILGGRPNGHSVKGYPDFRDWPSHSTTTHQQMYKTWLRRAVDGGLRLITVLATTNQTVCEAIKGTGGSLYHPSAACADARAIDGGPADQIEAAWSFEEEIDLEDDGLLNDTGWYKIVLSPLEARKAIDQGRLAVVLGTELDTLFGCKARDVFATEDGLQKCQTVNLEQEVAALKAKGVRHVFPVHLVDNAFGGTAIYSEFFDALNFWQNEYWIGQRTSQTYPTQGAQQNLPDMCGQSGISNTPLLPAPSPYPARLDPSQYSAVYGFAPSRNIHMQMGQTDFGALFPDYGLALLLGKGQQDFSTVKADFRFCNKLGLTPGRGNSLIAALIHKGMLIDIDHASARTKKEIMDLTNGWGYPVIAGHTALADISDPSNTDYKVEGNHENSLDAFQVAQVLRNKGMISLGITSRGSYKPISWTSDLGTTVPVECPGSTNAYARAYIALRKQMVAAGIAAANVAIGFGTDINGFAGLSNPRRIPAGATDPTPACDGAVGSVLAAFDPAFYPFSLRSVPGNAIPAGSTAANQFQKQVVGNRTYDIQTDGMTQYGMLPDFVHDLRVVFRDARLTSATPTAAQVAAATAVAEQELDPLYRAANAYIEMWEQAESKSDCFGTNYCPPP